MVKIEITKVENGYTFYVTGHHYGPRNGNFVCKGWLALKEKLASTLGEATP